jgi:hypothetical protein
MNFADWAVLLTGADRGIERKSVEETLRRGAPKAYAGTRRPFTLACEDSAEVEYLEVPVKKGRGGE